MQGSKRDTDVKNRLLDYVGEGEGGMIWENNTETCITICKIDDQCKFHAWRRAGALGQPRGMGWERGSGWGTRVHPWLIHVDVWQKPPRFCKVIILQLLLGIHTEETRIERDTCTPMFIAALFTISRTWGNIDVHWQMNESGSCGTYTQ